MLKHYIDMTYNDTYIINEYECLEKVGDFLFYYRDDMQVLVPMTEITEDTNLHDLLNETIAAAIEDGAEIHLQMIILNGDKYGILVA